MAIILVGFKSIITRCENTGDLMASTYIIDAPDYDKNVGGIYALHYLTDCLLNMGAVDVYLTTDKVNLRWKSKTISKETPFFGR